MVARWKWLLGRMAKRLWFRATLFSLLGAATALLAALFKEYIPPSVSSLVGADAVDNILGIIASSMLAVTTFSLSTMVSAYSAASSGVTPRATTLVMEDPTTQNALATFIGSFLFSLVGIIALTAGVYGTQGRVLLFGVTLLVVALIVSTLLRWIDHLSKLGRVGETIDRVEAATLAALKARAQWPCLGAQALPAELPAGLVAVPARHIGYIQHLDVRALAHLADEHDLDLYVSALPGHFVVSGEPLMQVAAGPGGECSEAVFEKLAAAFTIDLRRTFEHDPRFGLAVLSEIASRALSQAINDPGTAIDVIGRGVRTLACWLEPQGQVMPTISERVFVPPLSTDDLFSDFFAPIARDGVAQVEVGVRLLKALASLKRLEPALAPLAHQYASRHLAQARHVQMLGQDIEALAGLARELGLAEGRG
ncbi:MULTISPECIES: DUF2254 domain-containing protein [unclassified Pseudomonas]|uniref:DUF2254 domain-containing protein n=1 Tax=unclassified Pseudomonas TaxID=196821 RepID=UPI000BDCAE4A|nr:MULTISPECIES: DUF2254 domain-containing protein [unclassified Pseudomonas]PVZ19591.1 putative membrane protein [Pseudomonas sp. URIL14HWK12:I12]PVZ22824.1 putative membrane protein [Pseudomonas sp. URIL14HWK12:I10]PVZ37546.1 putative membrane protein [Pseudomonas sp. URIL14HWK12:I11]SNZ15067.1 Uncharacterized membrane protein [Pseudomonas sp. URIL14HWK12:I9]